MTEKLKVFLCHSSDDKPIVRQIHLKLKAETWIDSWIDEEKILPGEDWHLKITEAVRRTDIVLVFMSNISLNKRGYVQKELKFALDVALEQPEGNIFIIPVRLDECIPPSSISKWQYIDYFPNEKQAAAFAKIIESLQISYHKISNTPQKYQTPVFQTWAGTEFALIPKGEFLMGTDKGYRFEQPLHSVNVPYDYWMARFPVTIEQYQKFIVSTERNRYRVYNKHFKDTENRENHPAASMAWDEAMFYCQWLNKQKGALLPKGYIFRLPTEIEWEKSARGVDGREYPWGNEFSTDKCNTEESGINCTTPVDYYTPLGDSPYGCSDMIGNVMEWVRTKSHSYDDYNAKEHEKIDNDENKNKNKYIARGGSFLDERYTCYSRIDYVFGIARYTIGFRVAVAPPIGGEHQITDDTFKSVKDFYDKFEMPLSGVLKNLRKDK